MFSAVTIAMLLALSACGNADTMLAVALLLLIVGVALLPRRLWRGALVVAAIGFAAAVTFVLVMLQP